MPTFLTGKIYVQRSLFVESAYLLQCAFKFLRNWNAKLLYQIKIQRTLYNLSCLVATNVTKKEMARFA